MCARKLQIETINEWKISDLSKIIFLRNNLKKGAKYTLFSQSKQNNNFIFQKKCRIYTFYKKILSNQMRICLYTVKAGSLVPNYIIVYI